MRILQLIVAALVLASVPAFATSPLARGYAYNQSNSASFNLYFPSGTAVGDLAVEFWSNVYDAEPPAGWTALYYNETAHNWNETAFYRVLTQADVTVGYVTVYNVYGEDMAAGIAVINGNTISAYKEAEGFWSSGGGDDYLDSSSSPLAGDLVLFWAGDREDQPQGSPTEPNIWDGDGNPVNGTPNFVTSLETTNTWTVFEYQIASQNGAFDSGFDFPNPGGGNGQNGIQVIIGCKTESGVCNPE